MKTRGHSNDRPKLQVPDPYLVLNEFFERYELHECQLELWRLLSAAFSSEDADHWDKHDRGNAVFFCGHLDGLLKAMFELKDQLQSKARTPE